MNTITRTLTESNYHGTTPLGIFKEPFVYTLKAYDFLLDTGKFTLRDLSYRIREYYDLSNPRTLASVAALEAEHIWSLYLDHQEFPSFAPHSPHVVNNSLTVSSAGGMEIKREFLVRCPQCTDCSIEFSSPEKNGLDFMHTQLQRSYWVVLNHMQKDHTIKS